MPAAAWRWFAGLLLVLVATLAPPCRAADRALLIGVADYPNLPKRLWLRGPINDVALMREVLLIRGFQEREIRSLVSRGGSANEPTRANIVSALDQLERAVNPGDRVLLYFSGHGSQQPQPANHGQRPTEPDGLDEVFLPADVRRWDGMGSTEAIPNALLDDDIGEWIDRVVDRGGTVFAIFDTCHAAGMARAPAQGRWRAVSSSDIGLSVRPHRPSSLTSAGQPAGRSDGRALGFAARSHELAGEEWLPRGAKLASSRIHGVFTYHLANALRDRREPHAPSIEAAIHEIYRAENRLSPTPTFFGEVPWLWP